MNVMFKLATLPVRAMQAGLEALTSWPGCYTTRASNYIGHIIPFRCLSVSQRKQNFRFIEYDSGPCTADQIILQADKYGYSLVESVSSDFEMDKGLVKLFEKSFNHKELLKSKGVLPGKAAMVPYKDCYIYYLVTREKWWDRGCYKYLRSALRDMKEHCIANNVKEICMGRLGSSGDGLDWDHVRDLVKEIFKDTDLIVKAQSTR